MGSLSDYIEDALLDHVFGVATYNRTNTHVGLATAGGDSGLTEVTGTGYAREALSVDNWDTAASRATRYGVQVQFQNEITAAWGTITHWGIWDASTSGNLLAWGALSPTIVSVIGDSYTIPADEIEVSFDAPASGVGCTDWLANALLEHIFKSSYTAPTNLYVGFATTDQTATGAITGEAAGGTGYARQIFTNWNTASGGLIDNTDTVVWTVSGTWTASLDALFIADHTTSTNNSVLLFFGRMSSFSADTPDIVRILSGDLDITLD